MEVDSHTTKRPPSKKNKLQNDPINSEPEWYYYALSILSSCLIGLNCGIIAYTFMLGKTNIIINLLGTVSAIILNTKLFSQNGAKKLKTFFKRLQQDPSKIFLNINSMLTLISTFSISFLALYACIKQQAALLSFFKYLFPQLAAFSELFIPPWLFYTLTAFFTLANATGTFILFYDESDQKPLNEQCKLYIEKIQKTWNSILKKTSNIYKNLLEKKSSQPKPGCKKDKKAHSHIENFKTIINQALTYAIALLQSCAFTYVNFTTIRFILTLVPILAPTAIPSIISIVLSSSILISEYLYNYNCFNAFKTLLSTSLSAFNNLFTKRTVTFSASTNFKHNSKEFFSKITKCLTTGITIGLILMNAIGNGWIAIGDLTAYFPAALCSIIGINGTLTSFAVMSVNNFSKSSPYETQIWPKNSETSNKVLIALTAITLLPIISYMAFMPGMRIYSPIIANIASYTLGITVLLPLTLIAIHLIINAMYLISKKFQPSALAIPLPKGHFSYEKKYLQPQLKEEQDLDAKPLPTEEQSTLTSPTP